MMKKINETLEIFLEFESKECLNFEIEGVHVWKYVREYVYDSFLRTYYKTENRVHTTNGMKYKLFKILQVWKAFAPNKKLDNKDLIFLSHSRKELIDGNYQCTQIDELSEYYENNCYILENPYWLDDMSYLKSHFTNKKVNSIYTDSLEIWHRLKMPINKLLFKRNFLKHYGDCIDNWCQRINKVLKTNIKTEEVNEIVFDSIFFERDALKFYKRIVAQVKPKAIIEIYTPKNQISALNMVAHQNKIPVIELQHGATGEYEPIMYTYKEKHFHDYLPDYVFTFGAFWNGKKNRHIPQTNVVATGNIHLEKILADYSKKKYINKSILIVSQSRFSKLFYNIADRLSEIPEFKDIEVVLKLHPFEYASYSSGLYKNLEDKGVNVVAGLKKSIYSFFADAMYVIGVNSTCMYEALAFKKDIFVLGNKYGTEDIIELSKKISLIHVYSEIDGLIDGLKKYKRGEISDDQKEYLFVQNSLQKTFDAIKEVSGVTCDKIRNYDYVIE